jgi:hypothetical protein
LAQAFIFDLGIRQKAEPGVTDLFSGGSKWSMGGRWEEIDEQFCLEASVEQLGEPRRDHGFGDRQDGAV